jgi:hypothetical protein
MAEINLKQLTSGGSSDIDVNFNGTLEGQANALIPLNVNLTDGVSDITPTSVALTGNDLDIVVEPSGVLFKTIEPLQYTSYRTGDEGWQVQNNIFNYTPPTNPKVVADLDYTSPNFFNVLKSPLVVNGVSSTTRFVDVNGVQTFSATANADLVVIDKLTGLMYTRTILTSGTWNTVIDNALSHSITVKGNLYDDWVLYSVNHTNSIYHNYAGVNPNVDTLTSVAVLAYFPSSWTSSTDPNLTTNAYYSAQDFRVLARLAKVTLLNPVFVRNARNLITAP